jgi:hypothetical protein
VQLDHRDLLDHKVCKGQLDLKVFKVFKVLLVQMVQTA